MPRSRIGADGFPFRHTGPFRALCMRPGDVSVRFIPFVGAARIQSQHQGLK